jgi:glycosyltransferase involved in cell wall biosynthesis
MQAPLISIVMPVLSGGGALERALRSVAAQAFVDWELLAADGGSDEMPRRLLEDWARRDARVRVVAPMSIKMAADEETSRRSEMNTASALRNAALRAARGRVVTYLDIGCAGHDDEYHANYLQHVARHYDKAEMLFFSYDIVPAAGPAAGKLQCWDPARFGHALFAMKPAAPLGIAHRRELWEKLGGFNERLWAGEDWDFWKRAARSGAGAVFLPVKSGCLHVRAKADQRPAWPTDGQWQAAVANWEAGKPIFAEDSLPGAHGAIPLPAADGTRSVPDTLNARVIAADFGDESAGGGTGIMPSKNVDSGDESDGAQNVPSPLSETIALIAGQRASAARSSGEAARTKGHDVDGTRNVPDKLRKIAYVAPHCLIDPTSGAAVATAMAMQFLQTLGFSCRAFCGSRLDLQEDPEAMLKRHKVKYRHDKIVTLGGPVPILAARLESSFQGGGGKPLDVTILPNEAARQSEFFRACGAFLDADRPDVVITYGGDPLAEALIRLVKMRDIPLVFWLHNFAYFATHPFQLADYVIVPSQFNRRHYWDMLGLATKVFPLAVDWARVAVAERKPRYVTFVNPELTKGVCVFYRIAEQLGQRRPDIRFLVMSGRSGLATRQKVHIDLSALKNVDMSPAVADPREFYAVTKLQLMPSLWNESFGLVAAEAMLNGIPVLASNRGGLPETIGDAGFLFDIPARYASETRDLPTPEEVAPWVETIIRLWDDPVEYDRCSRAARARAHLWHPDRLAPIYRDFFGGITHQPGPPILRKDFVPDKFSRPWGRQPSPCLRE